MIGAGVTDMIAEAVLGRKLETTGHEVLKTILELKDDLNKNILIFDSLKTSIRKLKINSNLSCFNKCKK